MFSIVLCTRMCHVLLKDCNNKPEFVTVLCATCFMPYPHIQIYIRYLSSGSSKATCVNTIYRIMFHILTSSSFVYSHSCLLSILSQLSFSINDTINSNTNT